MSALLELAQRVEGMDRPDPAVDVQIFKAIGAPVPFQFAGRKMVALSFDEAAQCYVANVGGGCRIRYTPAAYTGSIDAAMSLVPDPGKWSITAGHQGDWQAVCWSEGQGFLDWRSALTPALALTAAALRALHEIEVRKGN